MDAHGPAERVPGAREAVQEHEHWGNRSRNILIVLAGLEALVLIWSSHRAGRVFKLLSAGTGLVAGFFLYETGEHGGELVYSYAGGVGRTGDPPTSRISGGGSITTRGCTGIPDGPRMPHA